jgi:type I restriction enzyme R subunit
MPTTDTSEKGLELLIFESLQQEAGYQPGEPKDYDRDHALDLVNFLAFLKAGEIAKRGTIDVLRNGVKHGRCTTWTCSTARHRRATPRPRNASSRTASASPANCATAATRPSSPWTWRCSSTACRGHLRAEEPLTKQTVEDAVWQYKKDRDPREKLFEFGRCVAHFAVDDQEVRFCTHLKGKAPGSCRSTRAGTTAPAIRRTRMG